MAEASARSCIFCGARPVTREHVWPQWLTNSLDDPGLHAPAPTSTRPLTRLRYGYLPVDDKGTIGGVSGGFFDDTKAFGGSVASQVVKAACAGCNNGWMAGLEAASKPVILDQIQDRDHRLTEPERATLVRWLLKSTAVFEMDDPQSAVLSAEERAQIADPSYRPGEDWLIETFTSRRAALQMAHGRVFVVDAHTGEVIERSLLQSIQIGFVHYVLQFRSNHALQFRRLGRLRREQLHPHYDPDQERKHLGRLASWRVAGGGWLERHLYDLSYTDEPAPREGDSNP